MKTMLQLSQEGLSITAASASSNGEVSSYIGWRGVGRKRKYGRKVYGSYDHTKGQYTEVAA